MTTTMPLVPTTTAKTDKTVINDTTLLVRFPHQEAPRPIKTQSPQASLFLSRPDHKKPRAPPMVRATVRINPAAATPKRGHSRSVGEERVDALKKNKRQTADAKNHIQTFNKSDASEQSAHNRPGKQPAKGQPLNDGHLQGSHMKFLRTSLPTSFPVKIPRQTRAVPMTKAKGEK